jgi:ketosteroid isomerase-like protein
MSQENVEIVRAAIDAFNEGDWDGVLKDAAPDFEFDNSRSLVPDLRGAYSLDQMRRLFVEVADTWEIDSDRAARVSSKPASMS